MNPWNTVCRISFDDAHKANLLCFYESVIENPKSKRKIFLETAVVDEESKNYLKSIYDSGYGIKIIARELGLTYSRMRSLFVYLQIDIRRGRDVVTDAVKAFRSRRIKKENNPWYDWCENKPEMHKKCSRGIQGYYEKRDGVRVWLRSTPEYIFAKWLDINGMKWEVEKTQYQLLNGETYRPDFFIYDGDLLVMIVEIKGQYFNNRRYKAEMLKNEIATTVVIIDNIEHYSESYEKDKREWKLLVKK